MNVLLISCYELGHQPFNLASPATHLRDAGFDVQCRDLAVETLNEEQVKQADLVALSTPMHTALRIARRAAKRVRDLNPDCHICFYGLYAGMHADYLLDGNGRREVDSVIGGEFERPMVELAQSLTNGGQVRAEGVITREHSGSTSFERQNFLLPSRESLPSLSQYARLEIGKDLYLTGYVEASRGCAHRCLHCPITPVYNGRVRIVQKDVVLQDIKQLVKLGAEHITFGDPDFLNGVKHSMNIVREMHEKYPHLRFDFTAKVEHILEHHRLFPELNELGCIFMVSAVELLNDTILGYLDKGHSRSDVEKAVQITREAGISMRPSLMPFTPWTSIEDILDILEFVEEFELYDQIDPVQYSIRLLIPPGSSILSLPEIRPFLKGFDQTRFVFEWEHPDPKMDELPKQLADVAEQATSEQEDRFDTYLRIREAVLRNAGNVQRIGTIPAFDRKQYAPRLTEDWFC
ncbi:radical SAM protein [candidate division KSB1 bacterium]|nr:radical SAM protein [candidate division KSB1 bacterium]NIR68645.1 radical SAM protein [candidate division KSB1 bacterium]NIS27134.1 radical SAM protein [candidate division KSB1 bacterium]NIT74020.1 radical SAM protein [candidate division KSB1 bacterium]NIU27886.1 radical SAM protein [candidate division KSB1 bacterium]